VPRVQLVERFPERPADDGRVKEGMFDGGHG